MNHWLILRRFIDGLIASDSRLLEEVAHLRADDRRIIEERIFVYTGIMQKMDELKPPVVWPTWMKVKRHSCPKF